MDQTFLTSPAGHLIPQLSNLGISTARCTSTHQKCNESSEEPPVSSGQGFLPNRNTLGGGGNSGRLGPQNSPLGGPCTWTARRRRVDIPCQLHALALGESLDATNTAAAEAWEGRSDDHAPASEETQAQCSYQDLLTVTGTRPGAPQMPWTHVQHSTVPNPWTLADALEGGLPIPSSRHQPGPTRPAVFKASALNADFRCIFS